MELLIQIYRKMLLLVSNDLLMDGSVTSECTSAQHRCNLCRSEIYNPCDGIALIDALWGSKQSH